MNVVGKGGSTSAQSITLYNASSAATTVRGTYRSFSDPVQIGATTTERVSAPASGPYPAAGAQAASDVTHAGAGRPVPARRRHDHARPDQ